jgi:transposase-like protein
MMMKRPLEFWQAHVEAANREGTSTSAYAKRHGVPVKSLYRWQGKLMSSTPPPASANSASAFISLRVVDTATPGSAMGCSLMLGSGLRLDMAVLPSPDWLAALVGASQGGR